MAEKAGEIYYDIEADVSGLLKAQGKANKSLDSIGNSATTAAKKMDELQTNINRVAGAIAASLVVDWGKAFLVAADNMSQLNSRIERLTGSAASASQTMQTLMNISSATGGSLLDTQKLWESLSTALKDTGATNGQVLQLTETLQKIGRIGGSSSEEMANALRQFGQSISSGTVRAEEFNSILEQMPELARQIAAGMGVSIGELRQLMLDGKLTAEDALNAIQKQTGSVNAEFEKLPRTLSQANTALTNSFLSMIDSVNQATGASSGLVTIIDSMTAALDRLVGKAASADAQISDLNSTAEMFTRRARTWSWLGLDGWEAQNKALAGLSNKAAMLVGDLAAVSKASQTAANTKPIEIKTTGSATGSKSKGGKSAAQKEAEQYAKAQESVNQKLDELRQKAELSAGSVGELSRAQAVLNAQQSLGNDATQEQVILAGQYAAKAWDNANALRAQAKAEKERTDAANKFSAIQGKTSKTAGLDSQYQKDIADIQQYAQLYPQKIGEAEAARAAIEQQYRDQRNAAMWEEWAQQNAATQAAAAAFDSLGSVASNALTGIITGSMSASDAMRSIGMTVLNSVINSFVQMGIEWVKSAIMGQAAQTAAIGTVTAVQTAAVATQTATSTAAAATTAAAWTPAAILSSIASMGTAAAIGLGAVAGVIGANLLGKRKNGGPVSAGGMYQVGEGGMPEIYQASTGKQYMIPGDNGKVISNKDMTSGGGGGAPVLNIYNYSSASVDAQAKQNGDGSWTLEAFIADMNNGGPASNAITSNMNVKRTPRGQG
ncbi:tape measure protein [Salmonella enterica subsp. enterica]|uniref:Tape measure protein n=1 Tax=Salmonella enterica TaxID=28901 RepID=A0A744UF87_SALER|nr:tape measure protein [Salmonella enterica]EAS4951773.1 phage tail tape measure protein [Salmonella enterica subsp. enterica serovar Ruiru]EAY2107857.1 phage tail tape measure protein [Salmonella enterica subsp. enterica serovar Typhimurium]EBF9824659.1 tape measure protein [Salmonella enterica subsp. enterica serovar Heidelberg]EEE3935327.1 tape measure protein [Salmonella enterica subsp. enterica serovar Infantis]EAB5939008.1 phage tail tape measure protein [Salmonella enterica subsp. ente